MYFENDCFIVLSGQDTDAFRERMYELFAGRVSINSVYKEFVVITPLATHVWCVATLAEIITLLEGKCMLLYSKERFIKQSNHFIK
jgi:hypothetical protein